MFGHEVISAAMAHAEAEFPRESCGLVVAGAYLPCENAAAGQDEFRIPPRDYAEAMRTGAIQAVVHSHPDGLDHPTENDMLHQMVSRLPWCILPRGGQPLWFGDQCPIPPLTGRTYRVGVTDCYAVIRDWYRIESQTILLNVPRQNQWWKMGRNLFMDNFKDAGFTMVEIDEARRGDVLLAQLFKSPVPNHAALYLGDSLILQHLPGRISGREPVARWRRSFTICLRYNG